jgi:hypothetical protein
MHPVDNPGQPAKKGRTKKKKKTLVLTLGSPPEKGGKKKKKTAPIPPQKTLPECRPPEKAPKKKKKKTVPVLSRNVIERTGRFCHGTSRRTDARTDYVT